MSLQTIEGLITLLSIFTCLEWISLMGMNYRLEKAEKKLRDANL